MTEYKEIQEQTYLNLDNGKIYFSVEAVLRIINNETESNLPNSISSTRLSKIMNHADIKWTEIDRKSVKLIISFHAPTPDDKHASSLNKIKVIDNGKLTKLINYIRSLNPTKKYSVKKLPYIEQSWGLIEESNNKDIIPQFYYSIARTVHEIQGHPAYGHVSAPKTSISERTLIKKAKDFVKNNPQSFKIIRLSPSSIDFRNSQIHANSVESYVNLELHDELLNHYKIHKGIRIKKELSKLDKVISSKEPVIKYIRKALSNTISGNSDAFEVKLTDNDIRAIDKSIKRQYDNVEAYAICRFNKYEDRINNLRNSNAKYIEMRGKLKDYLNGEYNSDGVIQLFTDKTAHHIIGAKLKYMFEL